MNKSSQNFYKQFFRELEDANIRKASDMPTDVIVSWEEEHRGRKKPEYNLLSSFTYKVLESRDAILSASSSPEASFFVRWKHVASQSTEHVNQQLARIATASVVMGHNTVVLTSPWKEYGDNDGHSIDTSPDYWNALFSLRPLLMEGRVIIMPSDFVAIEAEQFVSGWLEDFGDRLAILPKSHLLTIGKQETIEYCREVDEDSRQQWPRRLPVFLLPLVQTEDLDRFLEFAYHNESSLRRFKGALASLLASHEGDAAALEREMNHALVELDDRFDILSKELRFKGVKLSLQAVAFVAASLSSSDMAQIVQVVTGSGTVFDGLDLLRASRHSSAEVRDHDFWFPWAWNLRKEKKTSS